MDCPLCGRTIRVPTLDGRVEPLPEPELNLADANLSRALDELAVLDGSEQASASAAAETEAKPQGAEASMPIEPKAEPIELEIPPKPPKPIPSRALPKDDSPGEPALPTSGESARSHSAVLASLANEVGSETATATRQAPARRTPARSRLVRLLPRMLLVAGLLVGGFLLGQSNPPERDRSPKTNPAKDSAPATEETKPAPRAAFEGRITWKNAAGESRADTGALILVLPEERSGLAKLSVAGFHVADAPIDRRLALDGLRTLGGDVAFADERGAYSITLPQAGNYEIVVVSHFQQRGEKQIIPSALQNLLLQYFERPGQLLGQLASQHGPVRYNGEETELWDHSFEAPL